MKFFFLQDSVFLEVLHHLISHFLNNVKNFLGYFSFASVKILINIRFEQPHEQKLESIPTSLERIVAFHKEKCIYRLQSEHSQCNLEDIIFCQFSKLFQDEVEDSGMPCTSKRHKIGAEQNFVRSNHIISIFLYFTSLETLYSLLF